MSEAQRIAAKLTEAQRRWLLTGMPPTKGYWPCRHAMREKGLFVKEPGHFQNLSVLGLEVRKILEAQS